MKILVACEFSGIVRDAFIARGHDAMSCDLLPTERPGPHYQGNVMDILNGFYKCPECNRICISDHNSVRCDFCERLWPLDYLQINGWDMMIAFPPCTYLSSVQTHLCQLSPERTIKRIEAAAFFMKFITAEIQKIAVENPTGVMSHIYHKPDQIVHPYYFGDSVMKRTCLWLKNLPALVHNSEDGLFDKKTHGIVPPPERTWIQKSTGKIKNLRQVNQPFLSSRERSRLSLYLAQAMAEQWG